jgi:hypothetical protein
MNKTEFAIKNNPSLCDKFRDNPTISPVSNRSITPGKQAYNDLVKYCEKYSPNFNINPVPQLNTMSPISTTSPKLMSPTLPRPITTNLTLPRLISTTTTLPKPISPTLPRPITTNLTLPRLISTTTTLPKPISPTLPKPIITTLISSPALPKPIITTLPKPISTTLIPNITLPKPISTTLISSHTLPKPINITLPNPISTTLPKPISTTLPKPISTTLIPNTTLSKPMGLTLPKPRSPILLKPISVVPLIRSMTHIAPVVSSYDDVVIGNKTYHVEISPRTKVPKIPLGTVRKISLNSVREVAFTGIPEIDKQILMNLNGETLKRVDVNQYIHSLLDREFWKEKFENAGLKTIDPYIDYKKLVIFLDNGKPLTDNFLLAINQNNLYVVSYLLNNKLVEANSLLFVNKDPFGLPGLKLHYPLTMAIVSKNLDMVLLLLSYPQSVEYRTSFTKEYTNINVDAINAAALVGADDILEYLLEDGRFVLTNKAIKYALTNNHMSTFNILINSPNLMFNKKGTKDKIIKMVDNGDSLTKIFRTLDVDHDS